MRANLLASSPAHGRFRTSFRHTLKYRSFNSYTKMNSHVCHLSRDATYFQRSFWSSRELVPVMNDEKSAVIVAYEIEQVVGLLRRPFWILYARLMRHECKP